MKLRKGRSKAAKRAFDCARLIENDQFERAERLAAKRNININAVPSHDGEKAKKDGWLFVREIESGFLSGHYLVAKLS